MSQDPSFTKVYIDGSFFRQSEQAGIGVHWEGNTARNLSERCPPELRACSTRAEIHAFRRFLEQIGARTNCAAAGPHSKFLVLSDSLHTINFFTHLRKHQKRRGFINNQGDSLYHADLIAYTEALLENAENWVTIVLEWVPGHDNIPGNEAADRLAKRGAHSYVHQAAPDWYRLEKEVRATSAETKRQRLHMEVEAKVRKEEENKERIRREALTIRLPPLAKRPIAFRTCTPIEISSDDEAAPVAGCGSASIPMTGTGKRKLHVASPPPVKRSRSLAFTPIEISSDDTLVEEVPAKSKGKVVQDTVRHGETSQGRCFGFAPSSSQPSSSSSQDTPASLPSSYSSDSSLATQSTTASSPAASQASCKPSQRITEEGRQQRLQDISNALAKEKSRKAQVRERRVEVIQRAFVEKKRKDELAELAGCLLDDAELEREVEGL